MNNINRTRLLLNTLIILLLALSLVSCTTSSSLSSSSTPNSSDSSGSSNVNSSQQKSLFAATSKPGKVFLYTENTGSIATAWAAISNELGVSVDAIVIHQGQLYAAASQNETSGLSIIYRYGGGTSWSPVSARFDAHILNFAIFNGQLYAAAQNVQDGIGQLFRFDGDMDWTVVADSGSLSYGWQGFKTIYPWNGYLYVGDTATDSIARFDGTTIQEMSSNYGAGITTMQEFQGSLYAGTSDGAIYKTADGINFTQEACVDSSIIWSMQTYNNSLYLGMQMPGDSGDTELLYRWDNGAMTPVWQQPISGSGGVLSMVTNSSSLFLGTGAPAGDFGATGTGVVYRTDGQTTAAASASLGQAVTQLLTGALLPPQSLTITSTIAKPSSMLPGGTFFAYITLTNTGNSTAYITKGGSVEISNLPAEWTGEFTDAGIYGAPWNPSTSVQPGDTITVVTAITIPCDAAPGAYDLKPSLIYSLSGNQAVYTPASTYSPASVTVQQGFQGQDMASYKQSQAAVRQIRALSRNIGSGAITGTLNLTYIGIDGVQQTVSIPSTGGYLYRYFYEWENNGTQNQEDDYYSFVTDYAYSGKYEYIYQDKANNYGSHEIDEARSFYTFDLQSIPAGSNILSAVLVLYTGSSNPDTGNFYIKVHALPDDPVTEAQAAFNDAGNGLLYANSTLIVPNGTNSINLGGSFAVDFAAAEGGTFSLGIELDGSLSTSDTSQYANDSYSYQYSNNLIYTSVGTNPNIDANTIQYTDPEDAINIILNMFLQGDYADANDIAAYINEQYYSIGYWDLNAGNQCNNGNGNGSKNKSLKNIVEQ